MSDEIVVSGGEPGGELRIGARSVRRRLQREPWNEVEPVLRRIPGIERQLVPWAQTAAEGEWIELSHPRVRVISYPHEWCGEMLHDAALAHGRLLQAIAPHGLWLKDAHPWNVLFDGARPRFVDVGSIVPRGSLAGLDYLSWGVDPAYEVFRVMFAPYFLEPLAFHRAWLGASARSVLWRYALNGAARDPRATDYFAGLRLGQAAAAAGAWLAALRARARLRAAAGELPGRLAMLLASLAPPARASDYTDYYAGKGEAQRLDESGAWNDKQRNVARALQAQGIASVLDAACNTGWYARLAARAGKQVTAMDVDDACVGVLYRTARDAGEDIVPLVADLTALSPDRERQGGGLLMICAERRLRSDLVLALGILHHLVLGQGLALDQALTRLAALADKRLVVEFVALDDDKVRGEPGFFPALARRPAAFGDYTLTAACKVLQRLGWQVQAEDSHPRTRTLLVCDRVRTP